MLGDEFGSELLDLDYDYLKSEVKELTGIDLGLYKEKQMRRRINTLIKRKGFSDYEGFVALLRSSDQELSSFIDYITINVTEFFRTMDHWKVFEDTVLRELLSRKKNVRIWSCASSSGEEPYSIAMSALMMGFDNFEIIASDLDENVLEKARRASYDARMLESLDENVVDRFFVRQGNLLILKGSVRSHVGFVRIDLLKDDYPGNIDLIVCRNVLIYFTEEGKEMIYRRFHESMNDSSYLFTGNTEQIIYYKAFGFKKVTNYIYFKE